MPDAPIELRADKLEQKSAQKWHPFSPSAVKGLVSALNDPIAVFSYGNKAKALNAIVEITHGGSNFLVGVHFNRPNQNNIEVSDIRTLFPKQSSEWLNWIQQGKATYLNKKSLLELVTQQRTNFAEVSHLDPEGLINIINGFENPNIASESGAQQRMNSADVGDSAPNVAGDIGGGFDPADPTRANIKLGRPDAGAANNAESGTATQQRTTLADVDSRTPDSPSNLANDADNGNPPEPGTTTRRVGRTRKQATPETRKIAKHLKQKVKGWATRDDIVILESPDEIPEPLQRFNDGLTEGIYGPGGKAYIFTWVLGSNEQGEAILAHEAIAHKGVRELIGAMSKGDQDRFNAMFDALMDQIWDRFKDTPKMRELLDVYRSSYGLNYDPDSGKVDLRRARHLLRSTTRIQSEEWIVTVAHNRCFVEIPKYRLTVRLDDKSLAKLVKQYIDAIGAKPEPEQLALFSQPRTHSMNTTKENHYDMSQPIACIHCNAVLYLADPKRIKTDDEGFPLCDLCYELKDDPNRDNMLLGG